MSEKYIKIKEEIDFYRKAHEKIQTIIKDFQKQDERILLNMLNRIQEIREKDENYNSYPA